MPVDPSVLTGPTLRPYGGWLRSAKINGILTYVDSATFTQQNNYQYTRYALTFPTGNRQKVLHSRGTREVSFTVSGDLSVESKDLVNFLQPFFRGLVFPVEVQQGPNGTAPTKVLSGIAESFQLQGSADGTVKFTISGKSITDIGPGTSWAINNRKYAIPAWSSGNDLIRSWTLIHNTPLQANWGNNQNPFPAYYRPSESEYSLQIQTMTAFKQYDTISLGVGSFAFITGVVTSRAIQYSGREPITFDCQVTNVNAVNDPLTPGGVVGVAGVAPVDWI